MGVYKVWLLNGNAEVEKRTAKMLVLGSAIAVEELFLTGSLLAFPDTFLA